MKPMFWGDLKPVQQQDLEKLFEAVKQEPAPKQERFLRSQQAAMATSTGASGAGEDGGGGDEEEMVEEFVQVDAFDLAEPIDAFSKMPTDLLENVASTKWKDRKDALDAFYAVINVPRIKDGPFDEIVRALAKCMKDANIAVVTIAANCVDVLAKGLRRGFGKYRSIVLGPVMERLKEKRQAVADALGQALDSVFASTSLSDCLEDILEYLKHKNPQVKLETLRFLIRCLKTTRDAPSKPETKSIADAATKLLTESSELTRFGGAELLGTLMKIMGERAMNPYLDGLDEIRKTKIKEYFDIAEVKAKDKPKPVAPPPKAAAPTGQRKVAGKRPATGVKKNVPPPVPHADELGPASVPPKTASSKSMAPKQGAVPKPGSSASSGSLRLKKLSAPSGTASSHASSPMRNVSSPVRDDEKVPAPKFGLGGRGLAGRPLGKPAATPTEPAVRAASPGMSAAERAELDEIRAERDRLLRTSEDLRTERSKLSSQVNELQITNAQLIEDHTRDVLSIKAKETQLVRARSDAEAAEQMVRKQHHEIERLRRELGRAIRDSSPSPIGKSDQIYRDSDSSGSHHPGVTRYDSAPAGINSPRTRNYMSSPSEEKENGIFDSAQRNKTVSPPLSVGRPPSSATGGMSSPSVTGRGRPTRREGTSNADGGPNGDPVESWKRAAEVTSQLKARIEQMKV